VGLIKIF